MSKSSCSSLQDWCLRLLRQDLGAVLEEKKNCSAGSTSPEACIAARTTSMPMPLLKAMASGTPRALDSGSEPP